MPQRLDWMMHTLGMIQSNVQSGFSELHRRIDDSERTAMEWRYHFMSQLRYVDRKKNGKANGQGIPYAKIATLIGLIILGAIGHAAPGALRASIMTVLPQAIQVLIGG